MESFTCPVPWESSMARPRRAMIVTWLGLYRARTPGVQVLDGATAILGRKSEPQPDVPLRILPEYGGQSQNKRGFVRRRPGTGRRGRQGHALHRPWSQAQRLRTRRRPGIHRAGARPRRGDLVRLAEAPAGEACRREPEACTARKSFPGSGSTRRRCSQTTSRACCATLDKGLATPEHAAFVAKLAKARGTT